MLISCETSRRLFSTVRNVCSTCIADCGSNFISRDVRRQWWFFDGSGCVPWDFPSGACPSVKKGGDLFHSMADCIAQCGGGESLLQPCQPPKARPCSSKQLRFPYFAVSSPDDHRVTCARASAAVLSGHSCLTGTNRFNTEEECRDACASPTQRSGPVRFKNGLGKWRTLVNAPADVFDQDVFTAKTTTRKTLFFGRV
ncbi:uncharacterized protein LOC142817883 [Rhipicephalus microplus]|uniref:uncharacterized protein LOC142817883 n=1 Tax=Rhipicephalus microplus TaxID=6941 RepID=UPI003F6CFE6E